MNALLAGALSAIGGVAVKMLLSIVTDPDFIQNVFISAAEKIAQHTSTDIDDKIVQLAKDALAHSEEPKG